MTIPSGARSVVYSVNQYGTGVEIQGTYTFDLTMSGDIVDTAAAAAMDAFVASLEAQNPASVNASRTYTCQQAGDTWPTP